MAYSVILDQFEGPLDLLLQLIDKQKVAIEEVFVSRITEQYLACIEGMSMDMDNASDFLSMAATLLYIKSRALLPKPPREHLDEQEEDPQELLIRKLNEYRTYKQLCEPLRVQEKAALGRYYKLPEEAFLRGNIEFTGVDTNALLHAFIDVLARKKPKASPPVVREIRKEETTVEQCMQCIMGQVSGEKRIAFDGLFQPGTSRIAYIMTFVALLELIHENAITAIQEGPNATIYIMKKPMKKRVEAKSV